MHPDRLFLETLADLERRSSSQTSEYESLMIAGLLRKLLLDAHPLVDQVNRERRHKITYLINDTRPPDQPGLIAWNALDGLDPDTAARPQPKQVPIDGLLRQPLMIIDGHLYTVKDVILHQANAAGAVHVGAARTAKGVALRRNEMSVEPAEWPMQVMNLHAITRVVLKGLEDLRTKIVVDIGERRAASA